MPATKLPTTIPLGRVSLASLEYVVDPVVRLLYLRNTLEFVQQYGGTDVPSSLRGALDHAYSVRNQLEHPRPWDQPPTPAMPRLRLAWDALMRVIVGTKKERPKPRHAVLLEQARDLQQQLPRPQPKSSQTGRNIRSDRV